MPSPRISLYLLVSPCIPPLSHHRIGHAQGEGKGVKLQGVRFSTWGNGVQWENTASAAMASVKYLKLYGDEAVRAALGGG